MTQTPQCILIDCGNGYFHAFTPALGIDGSLSLGAAFSGCRPRAVIERRIADSISAILALSRCQSYHKKLLSPAILCTKTLRLNARDLKAIPVALYKIDRCWYAWPLGVNPWDCEKHGLVIKGSSTQACRQLVRKLRNFLQQPGTHRLRLQLTAKNQPHLISVYIAEQKPDVDPMPSLIYSAA